MSSDGYTVVFAQGYHDLVRYVEGDHSLVFDAAGYRDHPGKFRVTLAVTGEERWKPADGAPPLTPARREVVVRRVLNGLAYLGYNPTLAESAVWVRHGDRAVESPHGYVVTRVGPQEVRYEERGGRAMRVAVSDEIVAAWPVLRVYLESMARWLPPHDREPVMDLDQAIVTCRLTDALREMGARPVEFV